MIFALYDIFFFVKIKVMFGSGFLAPFSFFYIENVSKVAVAGMASSFYTLGFVYVSFES